MTDRRMHVPTAVVAAMTTAALVNMAQFPALELAVSDWYEAVRVKPGHELLDLAEHHFDSTRTRYELYLDLREVAPHATVTVPPASEIVTEHLAGLAAVEEVVRSDGPLTLDADQAAALQPSVVAAGEDRDVGPYVIAVDDDGTATDLVLLRGPDRAWLVEASLYDEVRGDG